MVIYILANFSKNTSLDHNYDHIWSGHNSHYGHFFLQMVIGKNGEYQKEVKTNHHIDILEAIDKKEKDKNEKQKGEKPLSRKFCWSTFWK